MDENSIRLATISAADPSDQRVEQGEGDSRITPAQFEDGQHGFSLPRVDGGKDAWLFLAGCFTVEALVWGKYPPKALALRHTVLPD